MTMLTNRFFHFMLIGSLLAPPTIALPVRTLVIDAGHGGEQTGVGGCGKIHEKDLVLDLAQRIKKVASAHGVDADVVLTRQSDVMVSWGRRLALVNQQRQPVFISLHADLAPSSGAVGIRVYTLPYSVAKQEPVGSGTTSNLQEISEVHSKHAGRSEALATSLLKHINDRLPQPQAKWMHGEYTTLTGVDAPAVMVGVGFLSHPEDCRRLQDEAYLDQLAISISEAVNDYERLKE